MIAGRRALAVTALLGVAACSAARPTPVPSGTSADDPDATTAATHRPDLGDELEVVSIPRELSGTTLEFASDGTGILYSSSRSADAAAGSAPDLWRFEPGASEPTLVWRNPARDHSIVKITGDAGSAAFVEMPVSGERAWNLWLVPEPGADAILLDAHPGDADVSSLVPSIALRESVIAWTAFDRGPDGPVSRLLIAEAPSWKPRLIQERAAEDAELWLPSLYGGRMVFTEVRYAPDRSSDERRVFLLDLGDPAAEPMRLDTSGRATMPLILGDTVLWKETEPGFNMFNWGRMLSCALPDCAPRPIGMAPQEAVNYPSVGERFVAWWGRDAFAFGVYDLDRGQARTIERYAVESGDNVLRPHVAGGLLVWLYVDTSDPDAVTSELRYAVLPITGGDRLGE